MLTRNLAPASLLFVSFSLFAVACGGTKKSASHSVADAGHDAATTKDSGQPRGDAGHADAGHADAGHAQGSDAGDEADGSVSPPVQYDIVYGGARLGVDLRSDVMPVFDASGALIAYSAGADEAPSLGTSHVSDVGGDGTVSVGRWNAGKMGGVFQPSTFSWTANEGFHYAIGQRSAAIPTTGSTRYDLLAATAPTLGGGAFKPGTASGSVNIAWTDPPRVAVDLTFKIPGDGSYRVLSKGGIGDPSQSELFVGANAPPYRIDADYSRALYIQVNSPGSACIGGTPDDAGVTPCMATVNAWLLGTQADHLGMSIVVVAPNNAAHALHAALSFKKR
jgi:hypothetical protein